MYMYIIINIFYSDYCNNVERKTENEILKLCTIKSILCRFWEDSLPFPFILLNFVIMENI